jgi:hypothetical protein
MRKFIKFAVTALFAVFAVTQSAFSEDDNLFGGDTVIDSSAQSDTPAAAAQPGTGADLAHGTIFQNGTVKVGGQFDMSLTSVTFFDKNTSAEESLRQTLLIPLGDALFTIDAHPSDNLRMYFKGGIHYPYLTEQYATVAEIRESSSNTEESMQNLFYVKELFTDFAIGGTAYFRLGKQTITWGTGYFFSPSSNIVNLSVINPEDTTKQVEGPFALRTQIVFNGSQDCIWAYMIPDSSLVSSSLFSQTTTYTMARDTAFALKGDVVLGDWELGLGGYYKYARAPKGILTASGTLFNKISTFAECVYAYGTDSNWSNDVSWNGKSSIWQATAGGSYKWKEPQITFAAQYYYDGNDADTSNTTTPTYGHNIAALVSFAKVYRTDITASVYGNVNLGTNTCTTFAMLYYSPIDEIKLGAGPYVIWSSFDASPTPALKLSAELGGGNF